MTKSSFVINNKHDSNHNIQGHLTCNNRQNTLIAFYNSTLGVREWAVMKNQATPPNVKAELYCTSNQVWCFQIKRGHNGTWPKYCCYLSLCLCPGYKKFLCGFVFFFFFVISHSCIVDDHYGRSHRTPCKIEFP